MTDRFDWLELDRLKASAPEPTYRPAREPSDANSFFRAAREMREHGYYLSAVPYYEKAIAMNDQHYDAWLELIDTLVRARDLAGADARSHEALDNYRLVRPFYAARALVLAYRNDFPEALRLSNASISKEEPHWYAFCVRGELLLRRNPADRLQALTFYEAAVECPGADWQAYFLAGLALLDAHFPALAAGLFAEAAHLSPRVPACWLGLGDSFFALRLYDQAMFYYQRVTELVPQHEMAIERQKKCAPKGYGLMKALAPRALQHRWKQRFIAALYKTGVRR